MSIQYFNYNGENVVLIPIERYKNKDKIIKILENNELDKIIDDLNNNIQNFNNTTNHFHIIIPIILIVILAGAGWFFFFVRNNKKVDELLIDKQTQQINDLQTQIQSYEKKIANRDRQIKAFKDLLS